MKKLFTILILLCAIVGAKAAVSVEQLAGGTILLTTDAANELSSLTNDQKQLLRTAQTLKIVGPLGSNDFLQLRDAGTAPKTVDLKDAMLPQSTLQCVYKKDVHNENEQGITRTYSNTDNSFPPIITVDGEVYQLFEANTVNEDYRLPQSWANTVTTLYLPENENYKIVSSKFCMDFKKLSYVSIPDNVKVIGGEAFDGCESLTNLNLNKVEYLCYECFYHASMPQVTIPGTCVFIGKDTFADKGGGGVINSLVFEAADDDPNHYMIIKKEAFNNMENLKDIYINSTSQYICENWAFSMELTYAHGDPEGKFCSLHFSSEVAAHYSNLSHPLTIDIAKDPALFHDWLLDHYKYAQQTSTKSGNGWWEFVNTGTIDPGDDPVPDKKVLRTYSDYNYDRIVPRGMKAYIVTGLNAIDETETTKVYEVNLTQLLVIPKRTGVILYGQANAVNQDGLPIISLQPVEIANGYPLRRDYWYKLTREDEPFMKNYLWPTCVANDPDSLVDEVYNYYPLNSNGTLQQNADGGYTIEGRTRTVLGPKNQPSDLLPWDEQAEFDNKDLDLPENGYDIKVLNGFYRNFYLNYYRTTDAQKKNPLDASDDFIGFFRVKKSSMATGHAYLRLEEGEFENPEGVEVIVNPDTEVYSDDSGPYDFESYQVEYNKTTGKPEGPAVTGLWTNGDPNMIWTNPSNWGVRPSGFSVGVKFVGEPIREGKNGSATMIISTQKETMSNDPYFYTMQGVRVAKPAVPGIYIHNGKKVVIK